MIQEKRIFVMVFGNAMDSHKTFLDQLTISNQIREVQSVKDSDVIIAFVSIQSRAGTDISAAMEGIPEGKPVILVALHHTFNPDEIVPDSKYCVNRTDVFPVDCLYHEDHKLLRCLRNDDAIRAVKKQLGESDSFVNKSYRYKPTAVEIIVIILLIVVVIVVGIAVGWSAGIGLGIGASFVSGVVGSIVAGIYLCSGLRNKLVPHVSNT
ncbi:uncharacterized protein LOC124379643 [Silurus meridionalis]|uniref:Uncharacterized protein n=1 Tax=Silurus meridionalis TaxID=175797 RepID=A0A8T0AAR4_SILME|nr:uncharacterized protein LOC124379643 [Silurus meridionalis]KAF7688124.1 hypothetical protein HF521_014130 [Silurus meridionalis]